MKQSLEEIISNISETNERANKLLGKASQEQILQTVMSGRFVVPADSVTRALLYQLDPRIPFHDDPILLESVLGLIADSREILLPKCHRLYEDEAWGDGNMESLKEKEFMAYRTTGYFATMHSESYLDTNHGTQLSIQSQPDNSMLVPLGVRMFSWQYRTNGNYWLECAFGNDPQETYSINGSNIRELSYHESRLVIESLAHFAREANIETRIDKMID